MKILIVSEDPRRVDWVRASVGGDATYLSASNGLDALRVVGEDRPDIVIADQTTESFGAFGLSRELKMREDAPWVVVILERPDDWWLARWSGADRWFVRPVNPFELAETVRTSWLVGKPA
ncbi:MAG: hypothetical protein ACRDKG_11480 [Actinomycetota bacterium]